MDNKVTIKWYGHACFTLSSGGYTVAIDPYDSNVPGYPPLSLSADEILSTHDHHDHSYFDAVKLVESGVESPFKVEKVESFHDGEGGALRGKNDIMLIEVGGMKIVHFGDLGHILNDEQKQKLKGADLVMIPVGGFYTIGPDEAKAVLDQIEPKIIVPMHYRFDGHGPDVIGELQDFLKLVEDKKIVKCDSNTVEITPDTEASVICFKFIG